MSLPIFINLSKAKKLFGISTYHFYNLIYEKKVRYKYLGRSVLVKTEDLLKVLGLDRAEVEKFLEEKEKK